MIMTAVVPRFFGGGIGVAIYRTAACFLPSTTSKAERAHNAIAVLRACVYKRLDQYLISLYRPCFS